MKILIQIVLAILLSSNLAAQSYIAKAKVFKGVQWSYLNLHGEQITQKLFSKCSPFSEDGIAIIKEGGKFLFLKSSGEIFTPKIDDYPIIRHINGFSEPQAFHNGLLPVFYYKRWGYIDTLGEIAIDSKYTKASNFNEGIALAQMNNKYLIINTKGEETPIEDTNVYIMKPFSDSMAIYGTYFHEYGYINSKGEIAIKAQFQNVGYFVNGIAWVRTFDDLFGYIDKSGAWVIEPKFNATRNFDKISGMARVKLDGQWAYVNRGGTILRIRDTKKYGDFHDGLALGKKGGKYGYFNNTGAWVIAPKFDAAHDFQNGYAVVKIANRWGLIDKKGNWVIQPSLYALQDMVKVN